MITMRSVSIFQMGAFLEPALYHRMNEADRRFARKSILAEMKLVYAAQSIDTTVINDVRGKSTSTFDTFTELCGLNRANRSTVCGGLTIDEELSCYIKAAQTCGQFQPFWNQYQTKLPRLAQIVRRFNAIPSTSVASEAAFSVAGFVNRKQRSALSSTSFRYSMVLKDKHLVDKLKSKD